MSAHMVSEACLGPVGNQPEAVGRFIPVGALSTSLGRFVPRGKPYHVGRFVPRGNRCHVGRSVPLTQHAMELSDDE